MKTTLYGAILGDIIGSSYESRWFSVKTKKFELFNERSRFTDDTVLTIAIADALLKVGVDADEVTIKDAVIRSMQAWGRKYIHVGYSRTFKRWIMQDDPQPLNRNTNGSAMRVSSVGWLFDTLERTRQVARFTAAVSHNAPEGIRGAESTARAIFLARNNASKDEIKSYVEKEFGYDLSRTLDEIRPTYRPVFNCDNSVPEALISFLESTDFEDTIRNAVSLGGDSDTQGAIAGSVAEAFYGIPVKLLEECTARLPEDMRKVILGLMLKVNTTAEKYSLIEESVE